MDMALGDHVVVDRPWGYSHHGIDAGDGTAIHLCGDSRGKQDAQVRRTPIAAFALGGNCEHFARWCVTGDRKSAQVTAVATTGAVAATSAGAAVGGLAVLGSIGLVAGTSGP